MSLDGFLHNSTLQMHSDMHCAFYSRHPYYTSVTPGLSGQQIIIEGQHCWRPDSI